ncbi:hypothetical protein BD626DRAFT_164929 [Schizophyllum amplum]|uniref:C3H1-type domain-containing protein n=1 Tax=Schizophyllum amplum TaxID=97359 RepID=A0A550CPU1_9AGAR|nr:hypothetical protein BD626DRAFT_164929 [Auriculariopsis ampla]
MDFASPEIYRQAMLYLAAQDLLAKGYPAFGRLTAAPAQVAQEQPSAPVLSAATHDAHTPVALSNLLARNTKLCSHFCRGIPCPQGEECTFIHDAEIFESQLRDPKSGLIQNGAPRPHCWSHIQGYCAKRDAGCRYYHPKDRELYYRYTPCGQFRICNSSSCPFRHPVAIHREADKPQTAFAPADREDDFVIGAKQDLPFPKPATANVPHACCLHAASVEHEHQTPNASAGSTLRNTNSVDYFVRQAIARQRANEQDKRTAKAAMPLYVDVDVGSRSLKPIPEHAMPRRMSAADLPWRRETPRVTIPVVERTKNLRKGSCV